MYKIFQRLADLYNDPECEIDKISLQSFLTFMIKHDKLLSPSITVSNEGNIKATWIEDDNHIFWIEFKTLTMFKYLLFMGEYKKSREETTERVEQFMKQVKWIYKKYVKPTKILTECDLEIVPDETLSNLLKAFTI